MMRLGMLAAMLALSGCSAAKATGKVAALPFKGAYHGTVLAGKGVYYTGKGAYYAGRGVYEVGRVPVRIADGALDASVQVLSLTVVALDTAGEVTRFSRVIAAGHLNAEIEALKRGGDVLEILVEAA